MAKLLAQDSFRLWTWLRDNWPSIAKSGRLTKGDVARSASKELGVPVTSGNITTAMRAIGVDEWPCARNTGPGGKGANNLDLIGKLAWCCRNSGVTLVEPLDRLADECDSTITTIGGDS